MNYDPDLLSGVAPVGVNEEWVNDFQTCFLLRRQLHLMTKQASNKSTFPGLRPRLKTFREPLGLHTLGPSTLR